MPPTPKVRWKSNVRHLILLLAASAKLVKRARKCDWGTFAVGKWMGPGSLIYTNQPSVSNEFVSWR